VNRAYERARAAHLQRVAGLDTVHVWDLPLPEPGMAPPRFTVTEASRVIREAMAPLGPAYARELARLLDPANGRLDMAPGPNRSPRPGFSTAAVGYPSVFYQGRYECYLPDVVIFAHEAGHAVQAALMDASGVSALNAFGPSYFTESFAGFTELLLADHLYRTAPDPAARIYYLQQFLDRATGVFDNARASLFEQAVYDSIPGGGVRDADAAEALMQRIGSRYSIWYGENGEWKDQWINHIQYYTWPLYQVNYVYSTLLALKYFELYSRDPAGFAERYLALLSNGYDDEPNALLRRFLGFDLSSDALVADAMRLIEAKTAELERLYAAAPGRR
jgi:oligoendopeptidase F